MLLQVKDDVVGAYVMPQFGRFRTAVEVLHLWGTISRRRIARNRRAE